MLVRKGLDAMTNEPDFANMDALSPRDITDAPVHVEWGLSFVDGRRIVRYGSRAEAVAEQDKHGHAALVARIIGDWMPMA